MGLLTRPEIVQRNNEKRIATLAFLADEGCSSSAVVSALLGLSSVNRANDFLRSLQKHELLHHADMFVYGRKVRVWGLTVHGAALSGVEKAKVFQPSRVSPVQLQHRFDVQKIRLAMLSHTHVSQWVYPAERSKGERVHDAEFRLGERIIALEVERTVKSRKRYEKIVSDFFLRIVRTSSEKRAHIPFECWYVCPTPEIAQRVQQALSSCTRIFKDGRWESLPQSILQERRFKVFSYDAIGEWVRNQV